MSWDKVWYWIDTVGVFAFIIVMFVVVLVIAHQEETYDENLRDVRSSEVWQEEE
jgi:hypothetical protein